MSYDIQILDPNTNAPLRGEHHHIHGGSYISGGTDILWTEETSNYGVHFRKALGGDGIYEINGKPCTEVISLIINALPNLQFDVDRDYWKPTEGNAKLALYRILALCMMRPDGVVEVSE